MAVLAEGGLIDVNHHLAAIPAASAAQPMRDRGIGDRRQGIDVRRPPRFHGTAPLHPIVLPEPLTRHVERTQEQRAVLGARRR